MFREFQQCPHPLLPYAQERKRCTETYKFHRYNIARLRYASPGGLFNFDKKEYTFVIAISTKSRAKRTDKT